MIRFQFQDLRGRIINPRIISDISSSIKYINHANFGCVSDIKPFFDGVISTFYVQLFPSFCALCSLVEEISSAKIN